MSRLHFHSPTHTAELAGAERHHLAKVALGPARNAWAVDGAIGLDRYAQIVELFPDRGLGIDLHQALRDATAEEAAFFTDERTGINAWRRLDRDLKLMLFNTTSTDRLSVAGHSVGLLNVNLNTAIACGSRPIRLAAKLDGWCEQHAWFAGPDRAAVADIIDEGLRIGIFRDRLHIDGQWMNLGWSGVTALLRESDDAPVVTSYSAAGLFPDAGDDVPEEDRWQVAFEALQDRPWLRINPGELDDYMFGAPLTVYDLLAPDRDKRVAAAFAGIEP